jgi:hypothetical protein
MKALIIYHVRSAIAGKVALIGLLIGAAAVWHFGINCQLTFNEAGCVSGAREYGADRPYREVTETLTFAGFLLMLVMIGATGHLTPNLLRKGFLDSLHARPISRPAMLISTYLVQWAIMAATAGGLYLGIGLAWGLHGGVWTHWLPVLAATIAVESAGAAAVMLFLGVLTERSGATTALTILIGVIGPAVLDKMLRSTDPESAMSILATAGLAVLPRTLLMSHEVSLGMSGHEVSYVGVGQILMTSTVWVLLATSLFVRRDY